MSGPSIRAENRERRALRARPRLERLEDRLAPATFRVNLLGDNTVAVNLRNGRDSTGHISLLSAIMAANARGGNNTIILPSGTIPADDFVIDDNLTIKGKNAASTIINGNDDSRGFDIQGGKVTILNFTIEDCVGEEEGGAILNEGGDVKLSAVKIMTNGAIGSNGSVGTKGSNVQLIGSNGGKAMAPNGGAGSDGGNAYGGGICNELGSITIVNSVISGNLAEGGAGGSGGAGGDATGSSGAGGMQGGAGIGGAGGAGGKGGSAFGGGVYNAPGASLMISGSSITLNVAEAGEGGAGGQGGAGYAGFGGADSGSGPGPGGNGGGGAGGAGGTAGAGEGGGLFNEGSATLTGSPNTFSSNAAVSFTGGAGGGGGTGTGGIGNNGTGLLSSGGSGGNGTGGAGGEGGDGGLAAGGGIANGTGGSLVSLAAQTITSNAAFAGSGGDGGDGGAGNGGAGGNGHINGGNGGSGLGGAGGAAGSGDVARGGGVANGSGGSVSFSLAKKSKASAATAIVANIAISSLEVYGSTSGGSGGAGTGGAGGAGGVSIGVGGNGGSGTGGNGGNGAAADDAEGGGVFNAGNASLNGVTVNITSNQANGPFAFRGLTGNGGVGSAGGTGGIGTGGTGGSDDGDGGDAIGGKGGNSGEGGVGTGGGLDNSASGTLLINPQLGAPKKSKQSRATDLISSNQADSALAALAGAGAGANQGAAGFGGFVGTTTVGAPGTADNSLSMGIGGGAAFITGGSATLDNTTISGNFASTSDNDVDGTFSS